MLLHLPNELLLQIFTFLPKIGDALNLSETCHQLHQLFTSPRHELNILQSIAGVQTSAHPDVAAAISSCLVKLSDLSWWIQGSEGVNYIFTFDYDNFDRQTVEKYNLQGLNLMCTKTSYRTALFQFLAQFHDLAKHKGTGFYEDITLKLFSHAAKLQEVALHQAQTTPDLYSDSMLIALALHCFVKLWVLWFLWDYPPVEDIRSQYLGHALDEELHLPLIPSVLIEKDFSGDQVPRQAPAPAPVSAGWEDGNVGSDLQYLLQASQRVMERGRKEDWPTVIHVLCLLRQIIGLIDKLVDCLPRAWSGVPLTSARDLLESQTSDLGRRYYIHSRGGQPLTVKSCQDWYQKEAGIHPPAVKGFCWLNEEWLQVVADDPKCLRDIAHRGVDFFPGKIKIFENGDPHFHECWLCPPNHSIWDP